MNSARIALLTSAGLYLKSSQPSFDLEREQSNPDWGDPTWRSIPSDAKPSDIGVAHLHINGSDIESDPEIALPAGLMQQLAAEGIVGSATDENLSVMGYQERSLESWHHETLPDLVGWLRDRQADGIILAPA